MNIESSIQINRKFALGHRLNESRIDPFEQLEIPLKFEFKMCFEV